MTLRFERSVATGLAVLLIAVTWLFVPQMASPFDTKRSLALVGALALALLFVMQRLRAPWRIPKGVIGVALLILFLSAVVSAGAADNRHLAGAQLAQFSSLLVLTLCVLNLRDDTAARRLEAALLIAAVGVALFALEQWLLPELWDPGFHAIGKMRVYSTLGNPNLAAFVLLAALPIAFFRARRTIGLQRAIAATALLLLMIALLATQSRQALLIAVLLVPFGYAWLGSPQQRKVAIAGVAIGLAVTVAVMSLQLLEWPPALVHTVKGRVLIWLSALRMLAHHPLIGVGLGHFDLYHAAAQAELFASGHYDAFMDNAGAVKDAHNDFLHGGATTGAAGLAGFAALCLGALWKGWRSPALRTDERGLYLALVACTGAMFFTAALAQVSTALLFCIVLALVLRKCDLRVVEWKPGRNASIAAAALLVAMIVGAGAWSYRELRAELEAGRGNRLMEQHDLWLAEQKYRQAVAWARNGERLKYHATTLFLSGELHEALVELDEAARYSGDAGIPILQGEILTRLGRYDEAIATYERLIATLPKMITPRFVLGQIYALRGEHALAQTHFKQVVEIEPSPFNLNLTREKVDLQKAIASRYLEQREQATP